MAAALSTFHRNSILASRAKKHRDSRGRQAAIPRKPSAAERRLSSQFPSILLVTLLTFASGCAALVFQVAWIRELRLVFGATTASAAAVLAIFMAGLGLGSAVLGKRADRAANPLRMYGLLEIAIALGAAATPWLIDVAQAIYIRLGGQESLGFAGATVTRLLLAAAVMAIPTFLMGGTLPAAVRSVTRNTDQHRRALGLLYGSNTLGAVVGAAVATFFALENLGTRTTLWVGCALGLLAGSIAVARSRSLPVLTPENESSGSADSLQRANVNQAARETDLAADSLFRPWLNYLTAAVLGFTFFAIEIVWYRMLGPILGGTAFTFGLILCVALAGIGVGGIAYNLVFSRLRPTWSALAMTCGCEALFAAIPYALGDRLALVAAWQAESATSFSGLVLGWTYVTSIVVLPVALVSGLQFPLLIALLGQGRKAVSNHLGMTYAWNTFGAIAGSLVAGFGALPLLTAPGMWLAITVVLVVLSIGILVAAPHIHRKAAGVVACLALATFGLMFSSGPTAAWRHSGIGAGRTKVPSASHPNRIQQWINEKRHAIVWQTDGIESTVGIDAHNGLAFIVNGKSDGNSLTDAPTQTGVAILAAVLHKDPKTALVIGLGTGESAGWLAQMRNIEHVDVVELEPAIDEMVSRCSELNWDLPNHPRVRRIYNDGREHIFTTADKYDLIISEPSNPYRAGIAALYTSEFYQAVRKQLNPGGLFVQWLQAYEVDSSSVGTVLKTAAEQFRHVEIWQTLAADLQLVCSDSPIEYTVEELQERIGAGAAQDALAKAWSVSDVDGFLAHYVAGPEWVKSVATDPAILRNTDDHTVLEYGFAKSVGKPTPFSVEALREQLQFRGWHRPPLGDGAVDWNRVELKRQQFNVLYDGQLSLALLPRDQDHKLVAAYDHYRNGDFEAAIAIWPVAYRDPADDVDRLLLARCFAELGRAEFVDLAAKLEKPYPTEAAGLTAIYHARKKEWDKAASSLAACFSRLADNPWTVPHTVDAVFSCAIDIAKADADAARRIYEHLSRPFAAGAFNYMRQIARVLVANQLEPERAVEALKELEPHVTWTAEVLELRARAYAAVNHPLAARAKHDWERFQRDQEAAGKR